MNLELTPEMHAHLSGLAERRGWTVEELVGSYVGVAADIDEAGGAALLSDDERAVLITALMALGRPEARDLMGKFEDGSLLWVRQSE